jgi:hypothetical protein
MTLDKMKILAVIVSLFQILISLFFFILAYFLFYNPDLLSIRTFFNIQYEQVAFYMLFSFAIGIFSIISGILILFEWFPTEKVT